MTHFGQLPRCVSKAACLALLLCTVFPARAGAPSGFDDIFKGIEPGKRFHPLWPPVTGQSILGLMVEAKKPASAEAIFETIESPTFGNSQGQFKIGFVDYAAPELTQDKNVGVDATFSQLDAIASQLNKSASKNSNAGASNQSKRTSTGIDYSIVNNATRKASNIRVEYYTLGTLQSITDGSLVNAKGRSFLSDQQHGWLVHRALRIDGLEYTLTSDRDFDAGFFAALIKWIPGVSVNWKNKKTIKLTAHVPVYVGYKLWRPGQDVKGAAAEDVDVMQVGIGDKEIEELYNEVQQ